MSKIVARPLEKEPDLLKGNENSSLVFKNMAGEVCKLVTPPEEGWTHDLLEAQENEIPDVWDAYLVKCDLQVWIGSSEV